MAILANKYFVIAVVTSNFKSLYLTIPITDCFVQLLSKNKPTFKPQLGQNSTTLYLNVISVSSFVLASNSETYKTCPKSWGVGQEEKTTSAKESGGGVKMQT
jgi:hypothetical protein